jgi:hypothetical protein
VQRHRIQHLPTLTNAAAMKLEKAGEVVSDAAKLTRLIHPNQGSGLMYDKLGMTIYTTPNITSDKASGLFEGMEHAGLAPVPPTDSVNYSNAQDKGRTSNKRLIIVVSMRANEVMCWLFSSRRRDRVLLRSSPIWISRGHESSSLFASHWFTSIPELIIPP